MKPARGLPWVLLAAALLTAVFVALGSWQVQRGLEPTPGWTIPFTHVYGHSSSGSAVPR